MPCHLQNMWNVAPRRSRSWEAATSGSRPATAARKVVPQRPAQIEERLVVERWGAQVALMGGRLGAIRHHRLPLRQRDVHLPQPLLELTTARQERW